MSDNHGPLHGVRVLELGSMYAAPTVGRMLRDFGADVVKVEDPGPGDFARQWEPIHEGMAIGFARLNAGKRSVGIDLRQEAGRALIRDLATKVDVLIENFRPGRMEEWGMSHAELSLRNRGLIMVRVSGFGQTGPYRQRPGFGTVAETASGYAFLNGWPDTPPTSPPFGFADSIAGIAGAFGAAMALFDRARTGQGREVDVALYEPLMFMLGDTILNFTATGAIAQRQGNSSGAASPRGIYKAQDGRWLSIAASNQRIAMRLFDAMGRPDLQADERYRSNAARMENNEVLQQIVETWVGSMSRADALEVLDKFEVVAAPVNDARDVATDPHFLERTLRALTGTRLGEALTPGPVLRIPNFEPPAYAGVPATGEHTWGVLSADLGIKRETFERLVRAKVVSDA